MAIQYKLAPSILAANFAGLGKDIKEATRAGAEYVHIDVMDGVFVPNLSVGIPVIEGIRECTNHFFDVHLMVQDPIRLIDKFIFAGADGITVHLESCENVLETIDRIKKAGLKAGVSIRPETDVAEVEKILEHVSMVLVMSVNPGYGGQNFMEDSIKKIEKVRAYIDRHGLDLDVEVDGGIYLSNVERVLDAGANVIVAGTAVFHGNITNNVEMFLKIFRKYK